MIAPPQSAMVLAAGLGTRLRPVTEHLPKPLVAVGGCTLIDHALDRLALAGVAQVVVNTHYRAAMIAAHLAGRDRLRIAISQEAELLDTGGGVLQALPLLGETFFVVNSDVLWTEGRDPALLRLAHAFDPGLMDALLLLQPTVGAIGYDGVGDYFVDGLGRPQRRREREVAPYLFAGVQLLHRRLFDAVGERVFSLVALYDRAEAAGRLAAIVHDGAWYHVGTPEGLAAARSRFSFRRIEG
ncbi:MAG TPA: nucleotidyltransferase family protein [Stellaceae bacterium]|nr:nucleotidyltransferase family protein [Stellaceae bacterium]